MSPTREEEIARRRARIEELDRSLDRWKDTSMPAYRRTIQLKHEQQIWLDSLLREPRNDPDRKTESEAKWYQSSPDIVRRRQIVLKNLGLPAKSLCKLFQIQRVAIPQQWEQRYGVTSWEEAYKHKKAKALVQKMISTDKKKR